MNVLAALVILLLASAALALPFLVMRVASRSRESLLQIIRLAAGAAIVFGVVWGGAGLVGLAVETPTVTVPIDLMPVRLPDGYEPMGISATVVSGGFDRVTVTASGFTVFTRIMLALPPVLFAATTITLALLVMRLARSLGNGDPFGLRSRAVATAGWVALLGGMLGTWAGNLADWLASRDLFGAIGWSYTGDVSDPTTLGWPSAAAFRLDLPFAPFVAGLLLLLLAAVFRHGAQLRADADGLV
jgi:hypothetical protein